jgi:hypothetical protein
MKGSPVRIRASALRKIPAQGRSGGSDPNGADGPRDIWVTYASTRLPRGLLIYAESGRDRDEVVEEAGITLDVRGIDLSGAKEEVLSRTRAVIARLITHAGAFEPNHSWEARLRQAAPLTTPAVRGERDATERT